MFGFSLCSLSQVLRVESTGTRSVSHLACAVGNLTALLPIGSLDFGPTDLVFAAHSLDVEFEALTVNSIAAFVALGGLTATGAC